MAKSKKTKARKPIPGFDTEDREREFWAKKDSTGYVDWSKGKRVALAGLKPSTKTISLRLPEAMLEALKLLANSRDVPYQSLLKIFLAEKIRQELRAPGGIPERSPLGASPGEEPGPPMERGPFDLPRL
jgi:predicted DNA binding CopG/RHH family protein